MEQTQYEKISLINGKIHTQSGVSENITFEHGRIVSIDDESGSFNGKVIDLHGRTVLQGFCDSGLDFLSWAESQERLNLINIHSVKEFSDSLSAYVIDGELKIEDGKAYLYLPGNYKVRVDTIREDEMKDQKVKASIRPEELVVDVNNKEGIKAVIDDAVFLGLNTHYFVHFEDGETAEIVQESKIDSIIEKGTEIRLGVKTEKINIFDEKGDHNLVAGVINDYDVYKKEA
ncbi:MAG: TOBE domain-containing protein [Synergistaceae bacterium]|nr:TOBE domain-containing protein [Synergistaceae bacterium]